MRSTKKLGYLAAFLLYEPSQGTEARLIWNAAKFAQYPLNVKTSAGYLRKMTSQATVFNPISSESFIENIHMCSLLIYLKKRRAPILKKNNLKAGLLQEGFKACNFFFYQLMPRKMNLNFRATNGISHSNRLGYLFFSFCASLET